MCFPFPTTTAEVQEAEINLRVKLRTLLDQAQKPIHVLATPPCLRMITLSSFMLCEFSAELCCYATVRHKLPGDAPTPDLTVFDSTWKCESGTKSVCALGKRKQDVEDKDKVTAH